MEETYPVDVVTIDLERQNIIQIDLFPLHTCKHLMYLYLSYNSLTSLDLAPLAHCVKLRELKLYSNNIAEIDLSPLENCSHLEWLNLGFNNLKSLDLTPLTGCKSLRYLNVTGNKIQELDASPIIDKRRLEFLVDVQKPAVTLPFKTQLTNRIIRLDRVDDDELSWHNWNYTIIPITQRIASGTHKEFIKTIRYLSKYYDPIYEFEMKLELLRQIGLEMLTDIEFNIGDMLSCVPEKSSKKETKQIIIEHISSYLRQHFENDRSSLFIDTKWLQTTGFAVLLPVILKRRNQEVLQAPIIRNKGEIYDLRPLWVTKYGYSILSNLGQGLNANSNEFHKVQNAFDDLKLTLNVVDRYESLCITLREKFHENISEGLREYIWWLVENKKAKQLRISQL